MLLLAVNYKEEINYDYFKQYDFVDVQVLNEKKGSVFAFKLQKLISSGKYDFVLHFGLCGGKESDQIGNIYKTDRSFLYYKDIIDNQRNRFGKYKFNSISNSSIVTKFDISSHENKLYDFSNIFDIETFWISQLSNIVSTPIFSIKGVSDTNDDFLYEFNDDQEIDFLLNPEIKRQRKGVILDKLRMNIDKVNTTFENFLEKEFLGFYDKFSKDKQFKKNFLTVGL